MTHVEADRLLSDLAEVLEAGDEARWAARIRAFQTDLGGQPLDQLSARAVLRLYGGAGTLSDVVLQPGGQMDVGLNDRLDHLRSQLYRLALHAIEAKN